MTEQELEQLVRQYEPVLLFSKDGQGKPETFFPLAAEHFVQEYGLRRKGEDAWLYEPGKTQLEFLSKVKKSEDCYLVYAVSDVSGADSDMPLRLLLDHGLEFTRIGDDVTPRVLIDHGSADVLARSIEERRPEWRMERQPLDALLTPDRLDGGVATALVSLSGMEFPTEYEGVDRELPDAEGLAWIGELEDPSAQAALEAVLGASSPGGLEGDVPARLFGTGGAPSRLEWVTLSRSSIEWDLVLRAALTKYAPYCDEAPVYHWHVWEDKSGWCALQYWFLYAFNDWAPHGGHNVHEGDWEFVCVFLDEKREPRWVASSVHVLKPKKEKWGTLVDRKSVWGGTHPVIYVGCGSHANYLEKRPDGEKGPYKYWIKRNCYDYAAGDSVSIGPAGANVDKAWGKPIWLDEEPWNDGFEGNWGALLKHWLGALGCLGEEGPTGPAQKDKKWNHPDRWAFGLLGLWAAK